MISLQSKRSKLYCFILTICFIASFLCFDAFKADGWVYLSDATNESNQINAVSYSMSNEDVCTAEMLGHTHTRLLRQQTATRDNETQRKSGTSFLWQSALAVLQSPFKFFTSTNLNIRTANANIAEIVHFIHAKDGKKRI